MKTYFRLAGLVVIATVITACSSSPQERLTDRLEELEERQLEIAERQREIEQEKREAEIESLPAWVLNPPPADVTGVYGVGIAKSKNMSHGINAARLQAEFQLAKTFSQELSGSERSFERGDAEGNVQSQTEFLIDKIVDSVPVVGYTLVEQEIVAIDGINNFYVLLKLPYDEFNRVLQAQKAEAFDTTVQSAFDDLERRLTLRRQEALEAQRQNFELQETALNNRMERLSKDTPQPVIQTVAPTTQTPSETPDEQNE